MALELMVEKLLTPKIKEIAKYFKVKYYEYLTPTVEFFLEYLVRSYEKYSIINTLVFHNTLRQLKDIYISRTLVKDNLLEGNKESYTIDGFPIGLIKKYKKILITDTAGMGKSTIMKRMFIDLIDKGFEDTGIPIYIELNRLSKDHSILQEILEELTPSSKKLDNDLLISFFKIGGFVFFLDGYDEISIADRSEVTKEILSFISKTGTNNYYFLTSRPEDGLACFGAFQTFRIKPLTKNEAYKLLNKYDLSRKKEMSETLVSILKTEQHSLINEFLDNPLLVSLLYTSFDYQQTIPIKKHLFYNQVYEAFFESHDLSKGIEAHQKRSGLDIDDFSRVLRYVGYDCLIRIGVKFDKDTILNSLDRAREFYKPMVFSSSDFLRDLLVSVPLFIKDGPEYKWAHKSFMEYFAAGFIARDVKMYQDEILTAIYKSKNIEKYINMLDFYYDIDYKGFSKNMTLPFCASFIEFYDQNVIDSNISKSLIEERISSLFLAKTAFVISSKGGQLLANASNLFNEYETKDYFINSIKIQNKDNEKVYFTLDNPTMNSHLAELFFIKKSSIVAKSKDENKGYRMLKEDGLPQEISKFEHNKIYIVDIKTGDKSEALYKGINLILHIIIEGQLDYEACKKEVERINKEIAQRDTSDLLIGI